VPEKKRQYGYFSLPILWDGELVARMDCKAEREKSVLHIHHLALEPGLLKVDEFTVDLCKELSAFMSFNDCNELQLHKTSPGKYRPILQNEINKLMS
jgi:hypothetical protein